VTAASNPEGGEAASEAPWSAPDDSPLWSIFDAAPDALVVVDARGRIRMANAQVRQVFGYAPAELGEPGDNGREVLRRMRADPRTNLVPVVVLTSSDEERDLVASYASGANAFVRKPVALGDFMAAVRSLGLFRLILNRPPPAPGTALDRRPGDGA
jgi:CheY-like chemotaxis protein